MIKRTLYFGNPAYLKTTNEQLVIEMRDSGETKQAPIDVTLKQKELCRNESTE